MSEKNITVFVVDDNIPQPQEFVEREVYNKAIRMSDMIHLVEGEDWAGEKNLQELLNFILSHRLAVEEKIIVKGFTHPEICLRHIETIGKPDVVVYDWEYGSEHDNNSSNWLKEIIGLTDAFVFVYSGVRHFIPTHLNKRSFDEFSDRFQLFGKGSKDDSLFSSEEFILQYIVSRVQADNLIRIQGIDINFLSSGYLKEAKDILYLENIFDRVLVLEQLKNGIDENSVKKLLEGNESRILFDSEKGLLFTDESDLIAKRFKPSESLTYAEVVLRHGLKVLQETLKRGLLKV
ncbi:hypothetical protein FGF1_40780 [Flavobacteriaceae bacterium GF1]